MSLFFKYFFTAIFKAFFPLFLSLILILAISAIARKKKIKTLFFLPLLSGLLSVILTYIAFYGLITEEAEISIFWRFIAYLAYWPSILLRVKYLSLPITLVFNFLGWSLVGFIIGAFIELRRKA